MLESPLSQRGSERGCNQPAAAAREENQGSEMEGLNPTWERWKQVLVLTTPPLSHGLQTSSLMPVTSQQVIGTLYWPAPSSLLAPPSFTIQRIKRLIPHNPQGIDGMTFSGRYPSILSIHPGKIHRATVLLLQIRAGVDAPNQPSQLPRNEKHLHTVMILIFWLFLIDQIA